MCGVVSLKWIVRHISGIKIEVCVSYVCIDCLLLILMVAFFRVWTYRADVYMCLARIVKVRSNIFREVDFCIPGELDEIFKAESAARLLSDALSLRIPANLSVHDI